LTLIKLNYYPLDNFSLTIFRINSNKHEKLTLT